MPTIKNDRTKVEVNKQAVENDFGCIIAGILWNLDICEAESGLVASRKR